MEISFARGDQDGFSVVLFPNYILGGNESKQYKWGAEGLAANCKTQGRDSVKF